VEEGVVQAHYSSVLEHPFGWCLDPIEDSGGTGRADIEGDMETGR